MEMSQLESLLGRIAARTLGKCALVLKPDGRLERSYRIHVPSGDMKYGSFWIRDAAMMAESGLIEVAELQDWIELICRYGQNGAEARQLANQMIVPPWSIPDHINFEGGAVYYPGTYSSTDNQGEGLFGFYPPHDDMYYFIGMLDQFYRQCGTAAGVGAKAGGKAGADLARQYLERPIGDYSPLERAGMAFRTSCSIDERTGLCSGSLPYYTVDWGFCDTIVKSGLLLFPSLLRFKAAQQLAELELACQHAVAAAEYQATADRLSESIGMTFAAADGWLYSATELGRQPDVWGTAFAVWSGALAGDILSAAVKVLATAYQAGTTTTSGYIRHIPLDRDFTPDSSWENVGFGPAARRPGYNTYQNGGYWSTSSGWYAYALSLADRQLAVRLLGELAEHTAKHEQNGSPYEWINADDSTLAGHYYGASAALPYAAVQRLVQEDAG